MPMVYSMSLDACACNPPPAGHSEECSKRRHPMIDPLHYSKCDKFIVMDATKVPSGVRRSLFEYLMDDLVRNEAVSIRLFTDHPQHGPADPISKNETALCWVKVEDLRGYRIAPRRYALASKSGEIKFTETSFVNAPYIPTTFAGVGVTPQKFYDRIKKYQDESKVRWDKDMQELSSHIMAHCMKAADEGKKQVYDQTQRDAWSAQLRQLVKASEEKTKADQAIYVQGEYDPWE